MASPVYQGVDHYGSYVWTPSGDWPSSRTLTTPSFGPLCLVTLIGDYVHDPSYGSFHHWGGIPASWTNIGTFGAMIYSGFSRNVYLTCQQWACAAADVPATVRPEKADNTLFSPSASGTYNYFRAMVTGWSPSRLPGDFGVGLAGETRSTLPYLPPSPICDGDTEGTWVQTTVGNIAYGGGPTGISTANGFSDELTAGETRVASKAFGATGSTDACIYTKSASVWTLGSAIVVALDQVPLHRPRTSVGILVARA